jgi:hypothetical protein
MIRANRKGRFMIIEGLCKCGHLESEHEYKGEASPCAVKCYDENTGLLSWHCPCYKFVNVEFESALGVKNLGEND